MAEILPKSERNDGPKNADFFSKNRKQRTYELTLDYSVLHKTPFQ